MRRIVSTCDVGIVLVSILIGTVLITGVDSVTLWGHRISSHRLENPVILLGLFLFFRFIGTDQKQWDGFLTRISGWTTVIGLWSLFLAVHFYFSWTQHQVAATTLYDLGIFDQIMYNHLHGRFFESSVEGTHFLGVHFSPILFPLTLLYLTVPHPEALLLFQVVIVSSGVIPTYHIAMNLLKDPKKATFFAYAFFLYPGLGYVLQFDFHPVVLSIPLMLWAYLFYLRERPFPLAVCLALSLSCKEEIGLVVLTWGLCVWFLDRRPRWGAPLFLVGSVYSILVLFFIIPYFAGADQTRFVNRYEHLGQDLFSIARFIAFHPVEAIRLSFEGQKIQNLLGHFLPYGFTSFLGYTVLPVCLPTGLLSFFSLSVYQSSIKTHYGASMYPFLLVGSILGVRLFLNKLPVHAKFPPARILFSLLFILVFITGMRPYLIPLRDHPFTPRIEPTLLADLKSRISEQDSLSITNVPGSHFSQRKNLVHFPTTQIQGKDVDKILVYFEDRLIKGSWEHTDQIISKLIAKRGYRQILKTDSILLLEKTGNP